MARMPKRIVPLFLVAAALLLLFISASPISNHVHSPSFLSSFHNRFNPSSATRVGPRKFHSLYHGKGCNASELMASVGRARIEPYGPSRFNFSGREGLPVNTFSLDDFSFSYKLDTCPPPHIFSPAETCDLISAFGGILSRGDSLMRQFTQGIFLLLTNTFDLVRDEEVKREGLDCSGNRLFTNGFFCKFHSIYDTRRLPHVCPEEPFVMYDQVWKYISERSQVSEPAGMSRRAKKPREEPVSDPYALVRSYNAFIHSLPARRQQYSPIYIEGTGIHYGFRTAPSLEMHINPFLTNTSTASPLPLKLWSGYPAPGANKPVKYLIRQGPNATRTYNFAMHDLLEQTSPGELSMGAWRQVDWFNSTDGAASYDGTHYSYQVAMERAQIFLNLLDIVWGEIVAAGGLVERGSKDDVH